MKKDKVTFAGRPVTGQALPADSPLKALLVSGVVAGKLTGPALNHKGWSQYFRMIWAKPESAKTAAYAYMSKGYGALNVQFWQAKDGNPKEFYATFDWSPEVWHGRG